jgi:hypothetical protein
MGINMKILIITLFIIRFTNISNAQSTISFDSTFLAFQTQSIAAYNEHYELAIDKENNKYVVGTFKGSFAIDTFQISTSPNITNNPYPDAKGLFIAKYNCFNKLVCLNIVAESDTLLFQSFSFNEQSNKFYISLLFYGTISLQTGFSLSKGSADALLLILDTSCSYINKIQIGGINGEAFLDTKLAFGKHGEYYLGGGYNGTWTNISPGYELVIGNDTLRATRLEMFIAKFDAQDNPVWAKSYGGHGQNSLNAIRFQDDYLYIISDHFSASSADIGGITATFPIAYTNRQIVAKLDTFGNGVWARTFGNADLLGQGVMNPYTLAVQGNRVYFSGNVWSNMGNIVMCQGGNTLTTPFSTNDYFICSYDTSGNFKWNTISDSYSGEAISELFVDRNNELNALGNFADNLKFPNDTLVSTGAGDLFILRYDSAGHYQGAITGGGTGGEGCYDFAKDSSGRYCFLGTTNSVNGMYMGNDTLYPNVGNRTVFFTYLDSISTQYPSFVKSFAKEKVWDAYPNPANDVLCLEGDLLDNDEFEIKNTQGQAILKTKSHKLQVSKLPNGVYYLQRKRNKQLSTKKIIIQH